MIKTISLVLMFLCLNATYADGQPSEPEFTMESYQESLNLYLEMLKKRLDACKVGPGLSQIRCQDRIVEDLNEKVQEVRRQSPILAR